ncbi:outer membrane beta-barrel protein [Flavobacterium sp. ST-87]|uniref:Outer membrane beta-barrel protein n=1 Tax=Flavobacterium plantiphilum TaxID=3163297 RepID=A0ABW8XRT8_9FLAO
MKKLTLSFCFLLISLGSFAQYGYRDSNRIGITAGINQFTLNTNNFDTKPQTGWNAGLSMRGNFHDNWDMVYGIQFSENNFSVATDQLVLGKEDVNYKLPSAQISLQLSYILIENHLSFEFGPLVQINGKYKVESGKENNIISGTTLQAKDIVDISKFNFYPTVGITAGVKHFRLNVSYQYGISNMLGNLNSKNLGYKFKGNPGVLNGNVILYL